MAYFKVISRHWLKKLSKTTKTLIRSNRLTGGKSNWMPPKYKCKSVATPESSVFNIDILRCLIISLSKVLLQNVIVAQLVKKFPTYFGTCSFTAMFTRVRHWSSSWAILKQPTFFNHISLRFIIKSSHLLLCVSSGLFPVVVSKGQWEHMLQKWTCFLCSREDSNETRLQMKEYKTKCTFMPRHQNVGHIII